jgi:hypothetical protein
LNDQNLFSHSLHLNASLLESVVIVVGTGIKIRSNEVKFSSTSLSQKSG